MSHAASVQNGGQQLYKAGKNFFVGSFLLSVHFTISHRHAFLCGGHCHTEGVRDSRRAGDSNLRSAGQLTLTFFPFHVRLPCLAFPLRFLLEVERLSASAVDSTVTMPHLADRLSRGQVGRLREETIRLSGALFIVYYLDTGPCDNDGFVVVSSEWPPDESNLHVSSAVRNLLDARRFLFLDAGVCEQCFLSRRRERFCGRKVAFSVFVLLTFLQIWGNYRLRCVVTFIFRSVCFGVCLMGLIVPVLRFCFLLSCDSSLFCKVEAFWNQLPAALEYMLVIASAVRILHLLAVQVVKLFKRKLARFCVVSSSVKLFYVLGVQFFNVWNLAGWVRKLFLFAAFLPLLNMLTLFPQLFLKIINCVLKFFALHARVSYGAVKVEKACVDWVW